MRQDGVMQQPQDFMLHGAVDLGARQAAAQRREKASRAPGSGAEADGPAGHVLDVTDETFHTDVLEKLAAEADGGWVLAKVDIDANPQLRAALQVQSIPMVVAVVGGQVLDGFLGALPEAQVRDWVGHVMAAAQQLGLAGGAGAGGDAAAPQGREDAAGPAAPGQGRPPRPGAGPDPLAD